MIIGFSRREILGAGLATTMLAGCGGAGRARISADPQADASWADIVTQARGQSVYWNAWAGDLRTNAYIAWAVQQIEAKYGVLLVHVKLQDTGEAVARILAEKSAGRDMGGSVDLLWINGENFAALKANDMLYGPFVERIPAAQAINFAGQPAFLEDFTIPVEGMEIPWGMSLFVFIHDSARLPDPPRSFARILSWAKAHPGRFTYPAPPDFTGSTFLKQAMITLAGITLAGAKTAFGTAPGAANFRSAAAPLFAYLDSLHPYMWRKARNFPQSGPALRQLLADGEVDMAMSFNPTETAGAIALGQLPASVKTFGLPSGNLSNAHFLAIPANSGAKAGAMVAVDFLLSPEAQARKADTAFWGDTSVLDMSRLTAQQRAMFAAKSSAVLAAGDFGPSLTEPHPAWLEMLEAEWKRRYGQ